MNHKTVHPVGRAEETFDAAAANHERADKLRRNGLRRQARAKGLELRHSDYGYSLVASGGKRVDDRNDLTLNEVETRLRSG
jgi:hypothetical protein